MRVGGGRWVIRTRGMPRGGRLDRTLKDVAEQMGYSHACTVGTDVAV